MYFHMCDLFALFTVLLTHGDYGGWVTIPQILHDIIPNHVVMLHSWRCVSAMVISANICSFITCSTTSTIGCSLVNSNVLEKFTIKISHSTVPRHNSYEVYHPLGTISKVWMNQWTHSYRRYACQAMWQCSICFPRYVNIVYFLS